MNDEIAQLEHRLKDLTRQLTVLRKIRVTLDEGK